MFVVYDILSLMMIVIIIVRKRVVMIHWNYTKLYFAAAFVTNKVLHNTIDSYIKGKTYQASLIR